jgi:protein TonB
MRPTLRDSLIACVCAVLVNAVVFLSIPFLNTVREHKADKPYTGKPVTVSYQMEKPRNKEKKSKSEPAQRKRPKPEPQPPRLPEPKHRSPRVRTELDLPEPRFEMPDPGIGTVAVSAPRAKAPDTPPKQPSSGPDAFSLRQVDQKPRIVSRIQPRYPHRARQQGISGEVTLKFLVDENGEVKKVSVISSRPGGVFEDSAVSAVKKWRFEPGRHDGEPVPTWVRLPVSFTLSD